jgi:predicted DsbA family dithiol-disulfide isomerase
LPTRPTCASSQHFSEGRAAFDDAVLRDLALETGVEAGPSISCLLDAYAATVWADEARGRDFGICSVPFFVIDRKYAVSGAQPEEVSARALTQADSAARGGLASR